MGSRAWGKEEAKGSPFCARPGSLGPPPLQVPLPHSQLSEQGILCHVHTAPQLTCSCEAGLGQLRTLGVFIFPARGWGLCPPAAGSIQEEAPGYLGEPGLSHQPCDFPAWPQAQRI